MSKPTRVSTWATSGTALKQDPGTSKQSEGWAVEAPPVQYFNWWMNIVGQWVTWLEGEVDAMSANRKEFDAVVGVGGTHADLNAVMADANILDGSKILVIDPLSLTTTQVIDKNDLVIECKPNVIISTVTALAKGIQIDGERVSWVGGRFVGWNDGGGDIAFEFSATAKNCLLTQARFFQNSNDVNDVTVSNNNSQAANISEVA